MVDALYQGAHSSAGTHNAIMSSQDYLSQVRLCLCPSPPAAICLVLQASLRAITHVLQHTGQLGLVLRVRSATSALQGAEDPLPFIQRAKACPPACRLAVT